MLFSVQFTFEFLVENWQDGPQPKNVLLKDSTQELCVLALSPILSNKYSAVFTQMYSNTLHTAVDCYSSFWIDEKELNISEIV